MRRRRPAAVDLARAGLEQRAVVARAQHHLLAVGELDRRELDVGGGELGVDRLRRGVELPGQREQPLALVVEDVRLLPVVVEDGEAVGRERRRLRDPAGDGRLGDGQQLGREPGGGGGELGEGGADPLEAPGHGLVAGVDVALQLRIAVGEVLELADLVVGLVGLEQLRRAARRQRALECRERVHLRVHVLHPRFPGVPVGIDRREVPAELGRDLGAVAGGRLGGDGRRGDGGGAKDGGDGEGHLHRIRGACDGAGGSTGECRAGPPAGSTAVRHDAVARGRTAVARPGQATAPGPTGLDCRSAAGRRRESRPRPPPRPSTTPRFASAAPWAAGGSRSTPSSSRPTPAPGGCSTWR